MSSKVVLGHPYHGALYWLVSAESWRQTGVKSAPHETHPYYQTLYGSDPHQIVDELISLCLLYDEIYIAPADCWLPDFKAQTDSGADFSPDLGIALYRQADRDLEGLDRLEHLLLKDLGVQHLLGSLPLLSHGQILRTAIVQLRIREQTGGHLLASTSYLRLCEHIHRLIGELAPAPLSAPGHLLAGVQTLFETASLQFSIWNLDEYVALRSAKSIRTYSAAFLEVLQDLPNAPSAEYALYKAMHEAVNSSDLTKKIAGGLSVSATLSGAASLVPFVGTVAGIAGLAADGAARLAGRVNDQYQWWSLAPEISTVLTRARIEARYKALELVEKSGKGG